jgi:hypothetical protein
MPILPDDLRAKVIDFFLEGKSTLEVYDLIYDEAITLVESEAQLAHCLRRLKGVASKRLGGPKQKEPHNCTQKVVASQRDWEFKDTDRGTLIPPSQRTFDHTKHMHIINSLSETMLGKDFERACQPIVLDILKQEGFSNLLDSNNVRGFHNPPFDFLGFKDGKVFIIEFKGSLASFNSPGETQKRRIQELRRRIENLNVALLQVKLKAGKYRLLCNHELDLLFDGREIPLDPVVAWIQEQIQSYQH